MAQRIVSVSTNQDVGAEFYSARASPPTMANGETGAFLVYELHLTNVAAQQWTLQKVEVLSGAPDARALQTLEDRELGLAVVRPGTTSRLPDDGQRVGDMDLTGVVPAEASAQREADVPDERQVRQ